MKHRLIIPTIYSTVFWAFLLFSPPRSASALSPPPFPVIFVHGIASNSSTWNSLKQFLEGQGWQFGGTAIYKPLVGEVEIENGKPGHFYTMNFSDAFNSPFPAQNLTFTRQGWELAAIIRAVKNLNPGKTKVILVAHSMGGLAARAYLESLAQFDDSSPTIDYRDDVFRLITVGTPHRGAELALICQIYPNICSGFGIIETKINPNSVAVQSLRPDSSAFDPTLPNGLNNLRDNPLPPTVGYTSIIGTGTPTFFLAGIPEDGDGIVPASSQNLGNLAGTGDLLLSSKRLFIAKRADCGHEILNPFHPFALVIETHTCEPGDTGVWAEILKKTIFPFDFALDFLSVDGNIFGRGNPNGVADFSDNFNDGSLTTPPTSSFFFPQGVAATQESGGFLRFSSADGARTISRFGSTVFEDAAILIPPLTDGKGNSEIIASFRADAPGPGQFYALGASKFSGSTLLESFAIGVGRGRDGKTYVFTNDQTGGITAADPVNLSAGQFIVFKLFINDGANQVIASYSLNNGRSFKPANQFAFFARHGTIFTKASDAHIFAEGGIRLP